MFKIIRCGSACDLVIAVSPETATPESKDATYYRFASWKIDNHEDEISRDAAMMYFSGQADGLGRDDYPVEPFASLSDIAVLLKERRLKAYQRLADEL